MSTEGIERQSGDGAWSGVEAKDSGDDRGLGNDEVTALSSRCEYLR